MLYLICCCVQVVDSTQIDCIDSVQQTIYSSVTLDSHAVLTYAQKYLTEAYKLYNKSLKGQSKYVIKIATILIQRINVKHIFHQENIFNFEKEIETIPGEMLKCWHFVPYHCLKISFNNCYVCFGGPVILAF